MPGLLEHRCHAAGCQNPIPPKLLMCRKHWSKVPKKIQRLVRTQYRAGQEITKTPSSEYMFAARLAIAAVKKAEGIALSPEERTVLLAVEAGDDPKSRRRLEHTIHAQHVNAVVGAGEDLDTDPVVGRARRWKPRT